MKRSKLFVLVIIKVRNIEKINGIFFFLLNEILYVDGEVKVNCEEGRERRVGLGVGGGGCV